VVVDSYVVFDTPGQIEVFTWSASGTIITEALVYIDTLSPLHSLTSVVKVKDLTIKVKDLTIKVKD